MGKLNEIQQQSTQSYGSNSFTTKIEENTVVFDSAKDSFTFNDPVDVPELTINGQEVVPGEQIQSDWNQNDSTKADYIKNRICYEEEQLIANGIFNENSQITIDTNDFVPIIPGVTYQVKINATGDVFDAIAQDDGGGTFQLPITFSYGGGSMLYNPNGAPMAPSGEKFHLYIGGNPMVLTPGTTVEITRSNVVKIPTKFLSQADWNQNDSTKADFIKNRIAYEEEINMSGNGVIQNGSCSYYFNPSTPIISGKTYNIVTSAGVIGTVLSNGMPDNSMGGGTITINDGGGSISWNINGLDSAPNNETAVINFGGNPAVFVNGTTIYMQDTVLNKIPEKFLYQSNWNQNDNTKADYIKNRICYEEEVGKICSMQISGSSWSVWSNENTQLVAGNSYYVIYNDIVNGPFLAAATGDTTNSIKLDYTISSDNVQQGGGSLFYYPTSPISSGEKLWLNGSGNPMYFTGGEIRFVENVLVHKIPAKFIPEVDTFNAGETSGSIEVDFSKNFYKSNNTTAINVNASGLPSNKTYTAKMWFGTSSSGNINIKDFVHFTDTDVTYTNVYATGGISQIVGGKQYLLTINYMKQVNGSVIGAIVTLNFEQVTYISY